MGATREVDYHREHIVEVIGRPVTMPVHASHSWRSDPKRFGFALARYKFVSKMLAGLGSVLEVGCGDGFNAAIVAREVGAVLAIDCDPAFIAAAQASEHAHNIAFLHHDVLESKLPGLFDAFYALDVIEHIEPDHEAAFLSHAVGSLLKPHGVGIVGCPSLESQAHASELSKIGHVNCKTQDQLKATMLVHFRNVFMFSFNDEVLHTGFAAMAHYHVALCAGPR